MEPPSLNGSGTLEFKVEEHIQPPTWWRVEFLQWHIREAGVLCNIEISEHTLMHFE